VNRPEEEPRKASRGKGETRGGEKGRGGPNTSSLVGREEKKGGQNSKGPLSFPSESPHRAIDLQN